MPSYLVNLNLYVVVKIFSDVISIKLETLRKVGKISIM